MILGYLILILLVIISFDIYAYAAEKDGFTVEDGIITGFPPEPTPNTSPSTPSNPLDSNIQLVQQFFMNVTNKIITGNLTEAANDLKFGQEQLILKVVIPSNLGKIVAFIKEGNFDAARGLIINTTELIERYSHSSVVKDLKSNTIKNELDLINSFDQLQGALDQTLEESRLVGGNIPFDSTQAFKEGLSGSASTSRSRTTPSSSGSFSGSSGSFSGSSGSGSLSSGSGSLSSERSSGSGSGSSQSVDQGSGRSNQRPLALEAQFTTEKNKPTEILLRAQDDQDQFLAFTIEKFPSNGILSDETIPSNGNERIFKYTPTFDFLGY